MMKLFTLFFLNLLLTSSLFAGSGGRAVIKGKSGTGRTQLELHTTDIDLGVSYLKLTIDGESYEFGVGEESETFGYIIHDQKNQVFTVFVDNKQIDFKFWMIPGKREESSTHDHWKFWAYVEATDPRNFGDITRNHPMSPRIYLYCTLDYSL